MVRSTQALTYLPGKTFEDLTHPLHHTEFYGDYNTDRPAQQGVHISNVYLDLFYSSEIKEIKILQILIT